MASFETGESTVIKALALGGTQGGGSPCAVDIKNGKAIRVRPLHFDWKFDRKDIKRWKVQRNGKTLEPPLKSVPSPFSLAYKKRVYSPNRIKYPLNRSRLGSQWRKKSSEPGNEQI